MLDGTRLRAPQVSATGRRRSATVAVAARDTPFMFSTQAGRRIKDLPREDEQPGRSSRRVSDAGVATLAPGKRDDSRSDINPPPRTETGTAPAGRPGLRMCATGTTPPRHCQH